MDDETITNTEEERIDLSDLKDKEEISKLREENKSIKMQRKIALCMIIGGFIGFIIDKHDKISDLLNNNPKVQVTTEDEYLRRNARLTIISQTENKSVAISESLSNTPKKFILKPGAYHLAVNAFGEILYEQDFTVENNEIRTFLVPNIQGANIRVSVKNQSRRIGPGSPLEIQVESSGNGYVWIFEKRSKTFTLIYPENCSTDCGNDVLNSRGFHLPDQKQRTIYAGQHAGEERLLFLVTSSNDSYSAKRLAEQFSNALILKASSGIVKENWGYREISYNILEDIKL